MSEVVIIRGIVVPASMTFCLLDRVYWLPEQFRIERMKGKMLRAELNARKLKLTGKVGELKRLLPASLLSR